MLLESSPLHGSASVLHYTTTSYSPQGGGSVVEHGVMGTSQGPGQGPGQGQGSGQGQGQGFERVTVRERDAGETLQLMRCHEQVMTIINTH